jgi:hypothetical protein
MFSILTIFIIITIFGNDLGEDGWIDKASDRQTQGRTNDFKMERQCR